MSDSSIPQSGYEKQFLGWASEAISESEGFLRAQTGYSKIGPTIDIIMGEGDLLAKSCELSNTSSNHIGKIALDLASGLTDTKPFWEYTTKNTKYEQQAINANKMSERWWQSRFIDLRFVDVIKYSLAGGTGWSHMFYNSDLQDIDMVPEDPRDILPIRPSSYLSIQDALGVIIRKERTVNYLQHLYPKHAHRIKADRDGSLAEVEKAKRMKSFLNTQANASPFQSYLFNRKPALDLARIPTVDFFTLYIKDDAINLQSYDVQMGDPDSNWSYIVKPGDPLYPRGRCVEFTRTAVLYDGPNPYWHGKFPLCKLTLDPWPWTWLGKAPLWDLLPLQSALNKLIRVVDDHNAKYAAPDLITNKNAISKKALQKIDTRRAGLKLQVNPLQGKGAELQYPQPLDTSIKDAIQFYIEEMNILSGAQDLSQLSKLGQIPSADTVERIIETMTPAVRLRSRVIEVYMREFAMMLFSNMMQFYSTPLIVAQLGANAITSDDLDFDPGTMVPDFLTSDYNEMGDLKPELLLSGPRPRMDRAKEFLRTFHFNVAQGSLLNASGIDRKMMYLQLARAGLIDRWTLMEVLGIPNVGEPPNGAKTITDRLIAEQLMGLGMEVNPAGRKASGQEPPSAEADGVVTES